MLPDRQIQHKVFKHPGQIRHVCFILIKRRVPSVFTGPDQGCHEQFRREQGHRERRRRKGVSGRHQDWPLGEKNSGCCEAFKTKLWRDGKEIQAVSKIQHAHLVSLLGYCNDSGQKILVYEYMQNGSLADYVKKKSPVSLSWLRRLNICIGAARGLQHLHMETTEFPKGIIHRDVKPSNILLDGDLVPKVSDFGMCKLSGIDQISSTMTTNLKGTHGYYAPEYVKYLRVTRKIDVYAFGVVLFQVLCRKMPWEREDESYCIGDDEDLGRWAEQNVDPNIEEEIPGGSLMAFSDIIQRSLQVDPVKRPTMDDVVLGLEKASNYCQAIITPLMGNCPREINHPFHMDHPLVLINSMFRIHCNACNNLIAGLAYKCETCPIYLHPECALLPLQSTNKYHRHGLELKFDLNVDISEGLALHLNHGFRASEPYCDDCNCELLENWYYYCKICDFIFHLACAMWSF